MAPTPPAAAAAHRARPAEADGWCRGRLSAPRKAQSSRTRLLLLLPTTALLPKALCLCTSRPPLGSAGKMKSLTLFTILKQLHGRSQKRQCYLIQEPLSAVLWCCRGSYHGPSQLRSALHGDGNCFLIPLNHIPP